MNGNFNAKAQRREEPAEMPSDDDLEMMVQEAPEEAPLRCCACGHDIKHECGMGYRLNPDQVVCFCCANNEP